MDINKKSIENSKEYIEHQKQLNNNKKSKKKKSGHAGRILAVVLFCVVFFLIEFVVYRGNYLQVMEIGSKYVGSYNSNVRYKLLTIIVSFLWMYILIYITNKRIRKGLKVFFQEEKREMPKFPNKSISFIASAVVSIITSNIFLPKVILFLNSTSFGKSDAIYGHDIGYYLFIKPFLQ